MSQSQTDSVRKKSGQNSSGITSGIQAPNLSLPKGGGSLRGLGEKFTANPVTGTGSLNIPLSLTNGRNDLTPKLAIAYDSGSGNGPLGMGWSLSIPKIVRKTEKGLPIYQDGRRNQPDSDIFLFSDVEDLVPELEQGPGQELKIASHTATAEGKEYEIRRYKPRIEGTFSLIERWSNLNDPSDIFWRSFSKDNILTLYGKDVNSRLADPTDPRRIFSWLICEVRDDKGNGIIYEYKPEDGVGLDLSLVSEANRGDTYEASRTANRYLKRILYGNRESLLDKNALRPPFLSQSQRENTHWLFEVVFDYGEYGLELISPEEGDVREKQGWMLRPDVFSNYRSGFELRTCRLCHRILQFHHIPDDLVDQQGYDGLVHSIDFSYSGQDNQSGLSGENYSFLTKISQSYYQIGADGKYFSRITPPLGFGYSQPVVGDEVEILESGSLENLPIGLDGNLYQWIDLHGEGIPGILTRQGGAWFYKSNLSPLNAKTAFSSAQRMTIQPSTVPGSQPQLLDLAGDGRLDFLRTEGAVTGFFKHDGAEGWQEFRSFTSWPQCDLSDPNIRLIDLDGDGHADILVTEQDVFLWHPSLAENGFGPARRIFKAEDEERGPRLVFSDPAETIFLADMSGDGLTDLVRIRNGEVCYWPNMGYGCFGAKVTMDKSPRFDHEGHFDVKRIRLADIDGSGTTDILYLHQDGVCLYFNRSGNSWSLPQTLKAFPKVDNLDSVAVLDLLGNGTACLVWSSPLPQETQLSLRYINLMGQKPNLLINVDNHLGGQTQIEYASSTKFYLQDKLAGKPWAVKLPFPVHVVVKVEVRDKWRNTCFSSTYSYHHGYFDGDEREFRGFGRVDQVDTEDYGNFSSHNATSPYISAEHKLYQPPVKTISWYHVGASLDKKHIFGQFRKEYFPHSLSNEASINSDFSEKCFEEPEIEGGKLSDEEWREALRACKGRPLRQEVYELDAEALAWGKHCAVKLFTAQEHNYLIRLLQPKAGNAHAVFLLAESENITYNYELDLRELELYPDPRISHTLNLRTDQYANPLQSVSVVYPRLKSFQENSLLADGLEASQLEDIDREQRQMPLIYSESRYTEDYKDSREPIPDNFRLKVLCETLAYELTGFSPQRTDQKPAYFCLDELKKYRLSLVHQLSGSQVSEISYHHRPNDTEPQKRLLKNIRILYFEDSLCQPLPLGQLGRLGLLYENYQLAFTDELLTAVFGNGEKDRLNYPLGLYGSAKQLLGGQAGYLIGPGIESLCACISEGEYWMRSGIASFATDAGQRFFLPERYTDAFGQVYLVTYEPCSLMPQSSIDPAGNHTTAVRFDYRTMAPCEILDCNNNISEIVFNILGEVTALAIRDKGDHGDNLNDYDENFSNPSAHFLRNFFTENAYSEKTAQELLGNASVRYIHYWGETLKPDQSVLWGEHPPCVCTLIREQHCSQNKESSPVQATFAYSDGAGGVILEKSMAEPISGSEELRWLTKGKTICNNKGNPVKQYEPYFSDGHSFEEPEEIGVASILSYDAVGRLTRTDMPDGSFSQVEFSPWHTAAYDANDTVLRGSWPHTSSDEWITWQANTPVLTVLNSLGRDTITIAHNAYPTKDGDIVQEKYLSQTKLDVEGNILWMQDARGNFVVQYVRAGISSQQSTNNSRESLDYIPAYDMLGRALFQRGMNEDSRWTICDAAGSEVISWREGTVEVAAEAGQKRILFNVYDMLRRPVERWLIEDEGPCQLIEVLVYGESLGKSAAKNNLRDKLYRKLDQSGAMTFVAYDFKGNILEQRRQLARQYEGTVNWQGKAEEEGAKLEVAIFAQLKEYDALNRVTRLFPWRLVNENKTSVYELAYNKRNLLQSSVLWLGATKTEGGYTNDAAVRLTPVVSLAYNAKGQRESLIYGNGTISRYHYDPLTFRLCQMRTTRPSHDLDFPGNPRPLNDSQVLQDLYYSYDPVGNITEICDRAFETAYFKNQQVEPVSHFTYDALYRLISATGREDMLTTHEPPSRFDQEFHWGDFPIEAQALANYRQSYRYDAAGNMIEMRHYSQGGGWTKKYEYADVSNRLLVSRSGSSDDTHYRYDAYGNMLNMVNTSKNDPFDLCWDYHDMIGACNQGGGGWVYYSYDGEKSRSRKVAVDQNGNRKWERIYLGGLEIYRKYKGGELVEEIQTLYLNDGNKRLLVAEDVIVTDNFRQNPGVLLRYQYSNHLGSAVLELDETARIISYEEYHPFGTSAYRAVSKGIQATANRYRYTGKERDEESGLYYHGARYYAPWLARWISSDPAGVFAGAKARRNTSAASKNDTGLTGGKGKDVQYTTPNPSSLNLYIYCLDNPIVFNDPDGKEPQDSIIVMPSKEQGGPVTDSNSTEDTRPWYSKNDWMKTGLLVLGGAALVAVVVMSAGTAAPALSVAYAVATGAAAAAAVDIGAQALENKMAGKSLASNYDINRTVIFATAGALTGAFGMSSAGYRTFEIGVSAQTTFRATMWQAAGNGVIGGGAAVAQIKIVEGGEVLNGEGISRVIMATSFSFVAGAASGPGVGNSKGFFYLQSNKITAYNEAFTSSLLKATFVTMAGELAAVAGGKIGDELQVYKFFLSEETYQGSLDQSSVPDMGFDFLDNLDFQQCIMP